jgi:F-type H+-transporting ATPase subunit epsilon
MADKNYSLDIVTPTRTVFSGQVESFSALGIAGSFQVLFNHAPMLSAIGTGPVKVTDKDGKELRYATSGGFVEVSGNNVIFLAETAERSDEIDVSRAEESKKRATERLEKRENIDVARSQASLARALNRLKVAANG